MMFENFPNEFDGDEIITLAIGGLCFLVFCFCCGIYCCSEGGRGRRSTIDVPFGGAQGDYEYGLATEGKWTGEEVKSEGGVPIVSTPKDDSETQMVVASPSRSWKAYLSGDSKRERRASRKNRNTLPRPPPTTTTDGAGLARPPLLPPSTRRPGHHSNAPNFNRQQADARQAPATEAGSGSLSDDRRRIAEQFVQDARRPRECPSAAATASENERTRVSADNGLRALLSSGTAGVDDDRRRSADRSSRRRAERDNPRRTMEHPSAVGMAAVRGGAEHPRPHGERPTTTVRGIDGRNARRSADRPTLTVAQAAGMANRSRDHPSVAVAGVDSERGRREVYRPTTTVAAAAAARRRGT